MKPLSEMGRYATVVIDPPWDIGGWFGDTRKPDQTPFTMYESMPIAELAAMPVANVLEDDALLFVWTTQQYLPKTFGLLEQWGTSYMFTMTWLKTGYLVNKPPGRPFYNAEWCIVGRKGNPTFVETSGFRSANCWPAVGHSVKPEEFYDLLRRVTPGPRLDIFGRRRIAGFDSWGNEAPDAPALPDHYQMVLA